MKMQAEQVLPGSRERIWIALNDADVLRAALPGCEALERVSDSGFEATVAMKVGPMSARFKGRVELTEVDAPNGYRISGEGIGGAAGFAKGGALVRLRTEGDTTVLTYDADVQIGGKLAQLGNKLIDSTARKFTVQFFDNLKLALTQHAEHAETDAAYVSTEERDRGSVASVAGSPANVSMRQSKGARGQMIQFVGISHRFKSRDGAGVPALQDISFTVGRGEFVAIVGPSGCGKSTLLRLLAGLVRPTGGKILVDGEEVRETRRDVGIVFQAPQLLPWKDVLSNVLFPLDILGSKDDAGIRRARELLAMARLEGFEHKMPHELSGGMRQRVSICRSLVHDPDILLMDEPFGALDALTREKMSIELMDLWTAKPKTIFFVTHSIAEAVLLADRVVVMSSRPGRVVDVIEVGLPKLRSFDLEATPEFHRCAQLIRNYIFKPNAHNV